MRKLLPLALFEKWINFTIKYVTSRINHGAQREFLWTVIPTVVLIFIAIPSIKLLYVMDFIASVHDNVLTYRVLGHQWFWSYEYFNRELRGVEFESYMLDVDDTIAISGTRLLEVDNPLVVPVNTRIRFLITSVDVLHSWSVPSLGIKVDAVPGRLNQICVTIKRPGEFYGQCSEICGVNHGFMPIKVISISFKQVREILAQNVLPG